MTGAVIAELARMVVAVLACAATAVVLLVVVAVLGIAYPGGWPRRRYRGQRRMRERAWSPW